MGKNEETEIVIQDLTSDFLKTNEIKLRSAATSLFDVQRWMFDVRIYSLLDVHFLKQLSAYAVNPSRRKVYV